MDVWVFPDPSEKIGRGCTLKNFQHELSESERARCLCSKNCIKRRRRRFNSDWKIWLPRNFKNSISHFNLTLTTWTCGIDRLRQWWGHRVYEFGKLVPRARPMITQQLFSWCARSLHCSVKWASLFNCFGVGSVGKCPRPSGFVSTFHSAVPSLNPENTILKHKKIVVNLHNNEIFCTECLSHFYSLSSVMSNKRFILYLPTYLWLNIVSTTQLLAGLLANVLTWVCPYRQFLLWNVFTNVWTKSRYNCQCQLETSKIQSPMLK